MHVSKFDCLKYVNPTWHRYRTLAKTGMEERETESVNGLGNASRSISGNAFWILQGMFCKMFP